MEATAKAAPAAAAPGISRAGLMLILTAGIASLLEIVDTSIVNVAIPTMMGNLGATLDDIGWVVTGYIISNAVVLPISGWLGLRFGRRKYYTTCIVLFVLASVACGLAPDLYSLIFFRVIQGAAGGALLPTSQALIQEAFPGRSGFGSALYGMVVIIGPTIGPPLGGFLTDHFGWRMIFNINIPFGILAAFLSLAYVKDYQVEQEHAAAHHKARTAPVDILGLTLLIVGIAALQYVLERGQTDDWFSNPVILTLSIVAGICLPGFVWWELTHEHPILDLRLYKNPALLNGTILMGAVGFMLYSLIFFVPIFASNILGLDSGQTGNLFVPAALLAGFMMPVIGSQFSKYDPRVFMFFGLVSIESCLLYLGHFTPQSSYQDLVNSQLIRGLGMPFLFIPVNALVLGQFKGPALGQAAGIMNLSRQLGGSIGIAFLATMFSKSQDVAYDHLRQYISPLAMGYSQWAQSVKGMTYRFADTLGMSHADNLVAKEAFFRVKKQAFVLGFDHMCWLMAFLFLVTLIPILYLKRPAGWGAPGGGGAGH
ncbi:MAG TPA: DHA2 family efflux MFS transporter permease subunit [bacterium]|nr:DHA2 family efflux MFS transporter permease subunit [bacterium]